MSQPLYFEELNVGDTWRSQGRTITEADVVNFAGMTGDYNPLHVDHQFARQSVFGKPVAHGLLGISLLAGLGSHSPLVHTAAFVAIEEWRFEKPLFVGETVHVVTEIVEKGSNGRRAGKVRWLQQLMTHSGEVLQTGIFVTLVARAETGSSRQDTAHEQVRKTHTAGEQVPQPRIARQ